MATRGLRSMTGFGVASAEAGGLRVEVEVRSVNHRHLKLSARVPEPLTALIPRIEERVRGQVTRGTVYLTVRSADASGGGAFALDVPLLRRFYEQLTQLAGELGAPPPSLAEVAQLEGVVRTGEASPELEAVWPAVEAAVDQALAAVLAMRRAEGAALAVELGAIADQIEALAGTLEANLPAALAEQQRRLRERVEALLADQEVRLEPHALARELALLGDKGDIAEELQRLRSHVAQLRAALAAEGPIGRKLEFLAQELLREANTMASKTHDSALVETILAIKLQVERVREQVANVE